MGDETSSAPPARAGACLLSALISAGGTVAMGWAALSLQATVRLAHGEDAVIGWALTGLAGIGAALCLYLAVIWALAALVVLAGPASRLGTALLAALRVLAPHLARRVAVGAAVASTTAGLVLAPVLAAQDSEETAPGAPRTTSSTLQLHSTAPPVPSPAAEIAGPPRAGSGSGQDDAAEPGRDDLPALGWGAETGAPGPASAAQRSAPDPSPSAASGSGAAVPSAADVPLDGEGTDSPGSPPRTVIVRSGDSLWSITDDLLGPGTEDPAMIAATWPRLHDANHDVIGQDPDLLVPGQELVVPTALTSQEKP